jgi:hypothetical protein
MPTTTPAPFVPRCACGAAVGWTRLIRAWPNAPQCDGCKIEAARAALAQPRG